jgi:putative phosphoesterase
MKVGLMADTHDRMPAIDELLNRMQQAGVGMVLHAGDYCSPFSLAPFRERNMALAGVFGKNDGDREGLRAYASAGMGNELFESPHSFEMGGRRILLVHDIGDVTVRSIRSHAIVVHGHTHQQEMRTRGESLILNPGEGCGWLHGTPNAAILDLDELTVEMLSLTEAEWKGR